VRTRRSAAKAWERLVSLNLKGYGYISYKFEKKYVRFPNQRTTQTEDQRTTQTEETRIPGSASRPLPGSSPERKRERNRRTWYGHIRNQEVRIRTVSMGEPWYMWYMGLVCLLFLAASVCLLFLTEETRPLHCKPAHLDFHFGERGFQPLELSRTWFISISSGASIQSGRGMTSSQRIDNPCQRGGGKGVSSRLH
jgi:hypothetical protein